MTCGILTSSTVKILNSGQLLDFELKTSDKFEINHGKSAGFKITTKQM